MLVQALLAGCINGLGRLFGNQMAFDRPLIAGTLVGLVYGNLTLGLAVGGTLELMWMGVEGIGGARPANVTVSTIFATAMACILGKGVTEAVAMAVPVSLLSQVIDNLATSANSFFQRRFETLANKGDIDGLVRWVWAFYPYTFILGVIIIFFPVYYGTGAIESLLNAVPDWLMKGLGTAGGMLPAVGFAMVLGMMYKIELLPMLLLGFALGAYLGMPILGVTFIGISVTALVFWIRAYVRQQGGESTDV